jgi:hypothetical protein
MIPSVEVHGGICRHHRDPAIRLPAAGFGGLFAPSLSPRLDRPGQDSNALFASQSQSFLHGIQKILRPQQLRWAKL